MPRLTKQKDFRTARELPFCYVCGLALTDGELRTRDHVPARACFAQEDRNHPLLLPTHATCNSDNKLVDEKIGQLVGLRRGVAPEQSRRRLKLRLLKDLEGDVLGGVNNLDIPAAIKRWVTAFHAALYREPLPRDTTFAMETPFAAATISSDGKIEAQPMREEQHAKFVELLKRQRASDNVDVIVCNNGKLVYECVWDEFDDHRGWLCIFGLDLYGWADLGDTKRFPRRACVGSYVLRELGTPDAATRAKPFRVHVPNSDPFDPFRG